MDFYAEVDAGSYRFSVPAHGFDGVAHLVGMSLEVGHVAPLIEEWREMTNGRESPFFGFDNPGHECVGGVPEHVVVHASPVSHLASKKLVDRHVEVFAHDVPECDV